MLAIPSSALAIKSQPCAEKRRRGLDRVLETDEVNRLVRHYSHLDQTSQATEKWFFSLSMGIFASRAWTPWSASTDLAPQLYGSKSMSARSCDYNGKEIIQLKERNKGKRQRPAGWTGLTPWCQWTQRRSRRSLKKIKCLPKLGSERIPKIVRNHDLPLEGPTSSLQIKPLPKRFATADWTCAAHFLFSCCSSSSVKAPAMRV